jgi:hypothetical protein
VSKGERSKGERSKGERSKGERREEEQLRVERVNDRNKIKGLKDGQERTMRWKKGVSYWWLGVRRKNKN